MLDIRLIRETPEVVEEAVRRRGGSADIARVRELDEQRRALNTQVDGLRAERNSASKEIGAAAKRGDDVEAAKAAVRELGERLAARYSSHALSQIDVFREVAGVTGLIMTKLDGTARGGVLVAAAEQYGLPIHAIGVGEKIDDLRPFDPDLVARVIAGVA